MLERTFLHISGITAAIEKSLWRQGCTHWSSYLQEPNRFDVGPASPDEVQDALLESIGALKERNAKFFMRRLGIAESWRAYPAFKSGAVYLDIETDGGKAGNAVTVVGLYYGGEFRCLIKGKDLHEFPQLISEFEMIVTFFGSGFDLPMLEKRFRTLRFEQLHLDLCPAFRKVGVRGGLKKIEKEMGLSRGDDTDGLNGLDAIRLWNRYQTLGDHEALATLVAYNREDVVNLEHLATIAYERLAKSTFGVEAP